MIRVEIMHSCAARHGTLSTVKTTVAAIMLPLAFGIDTVVIPGPAVGQAFISLLPWTLELSSSLNDHTIGTSSSMLTFARC